MVTEIRDVADKKHIAVYTTEQAISTRLSRFVSLVGVTYYQQATWRESPGAWPIVAADLVFPKVQEARLRRDLALDALPRIASTRKPRALVSTTRGTYFEPKNAVQTAFSL